MSIHSQNNTVTTPVDDSMPPPSKVMRQGSQELEDAIKTGHVKLSLPHLEWSAWITPNPVQQWRDHPASQTGEPTSSRTVDTAFCSEDDSSTVADEDAFSRTGCTTPTSTTSAIRSSEQPHDQSSLSNKTSVASQEQENNSESFVDRSLPRFSDIIGHSAVKLRLDEVLLPIALPPAMVDTILVGVRSFSASILLFGPPGCGKTQLAKAIAGEAEAAFLSAGPSDIMSKFVGESEAAIRSLFDQGTTTNSCAHGALLRPQISQCTAQHMNKLERSEANAPSSSSMKLMPWASHVEVVEYKVKRAQRWIQVRDASLPSSSSN